MVIQHRREQVVRRADGVKISRKVEVNVLHGHHLRISAARRAALHAEHGAERRLPQGDDRALAELAQAVRESHGGGGLALARRGWRDGGDENQLAVGFADEIAQEIIVNLRLVFAVLLNVALVDFQRAGDIQNRLHGGRLCDFDVRE